MKEGDFTNLVRMPVLVAGVITYNIIAIAVLWLFDFSLAAINAIAAFILATLALLRFSEKVSSWARKQDVSRKQFNELLTFPLFLWSALTVISLAPWLWLQG